MKNYIKFLFLVFLYSTGVIAQQQIITKAEAVQLALENNYGIKIADNNLKIAKNNAGILNSGYLPTLTGNTGASYTQNDTDAVFRDGTSTSLTRAESRRYNASLNLNYTLFDGLGRRYNYKQLKEQYNLSELQARETIENTILQLFTVYYDVARLTENVTLLNESLKISKNRLTRANYQFEYGQNTKLFVLNAEVDVNNDSINLLNTKQLLANAKRDLYVVLGKDEIPNFTVDTLVSFIIPPNKLEMMDLVKVNNVILQQIEKNIKISDFQLKSNKSGYLPTVGLTGTYGWNENQNNSSSFLSTLTNTGFTGGVNFTWDLFNGGQTKTQVRNAKINLETQQLFKQQAELEITRDFNNAFEDYQNKLFVLQTQEKNVQTNINNFDRTEESFKLGQITSIEFRLAQLNLVNAINDKNDAKYAAKLAELQLLQLSGQLLDVEF